MRERENLWGQPGDSAERLNALADRVRETHRRLDVTLDIDVVGDECFDDRELRRRKQHPPQRTAAPDLEREIRAGINVAAIDGPLPKSDIVRALERRTENDVEHRDGSVDRGVPP